MAAWLAAPCSVWAHKPSDSYLSFEILPDRLEVQWDIALRDLEFVIGLDSNNDGQITWGELEAKQKEVEGYACGRLRLLVDAGQTPVKTTDLLVAEHTDGAYAVLRFNAPLPPGGRELQIEYSLLFETDPQHRGLYQVLHQGATQTGVFSPTDRLYRCGLEIGAAPGAGNHGFSAFVVEGVWHIWQGYDHILFLLALLLPAVLRRVGSRWEVADSPRAATLGVFKVVTAFTAAHSLTLSLATLGFVRLPSRLVESTIAASVVLAACNNLRPVLSDRGWVVAFVFGLIHGFGFASVLADLGLPAGSLAKALVGFNLGVEVGQLAIVAVFLPLAYLLRRSWFYQRLTLQLGSALIAAIAAIWMCERVFDFKLMPF